MALHIIIVQTGPTVNGNCAQTYSITMHIEMYLVSKWNSSTKFQLDFSFTSQVNVYNGILVVAYIQFLVRPHVVGLRILVDFSNNTWYVTLTDVSKHRPMDIQKSCSTNNADQFQYKPPFNFNAEYYINRNKVSINLLHKYAFNLSMYTEYRSYPRLANRRYTSGTSNDFLLHTQMLLMFRQITWCCSMPLSSCQLNNTIQSNTEY